MYWEVAGSIGHKARSLGHKTRVRILALLLLCCEALGKFSLCALVSISVKWDQSSQFVEETLAMKGLCQWRSAGPLTFVLT